jgi:hypothetical protein
MKPKKFKTLTTFLLLLPLCVVLLGSGCKDDNAINGKIKIKDFNYTGCKNENELEESADTELIEYKVADGNYLEIKHKDVYFNCCFDELITNVELDSTSIIFTEDETGAGCDCICRYDIECKIGPLEYGEYLFVLKRSTRIKSEFKLLFNFSTDSTYIIN